MPLNLELLRKVRDHIKEEPLRMNMSCWVKEDELAPCGTVGCIAGWAAILHKKAQKKRLKCYDDAEDIATKALVLGLNAPYKLFIPEGWPKKYKERRTNLISDFNFNFNSSDFRKGEAKIVVDLLNEVIRRKKIWW